MDSSSYLKSAVMDTVEYYLCLFYFFQGKSYRKCHYFNDRPHVRVFLYSYYITFFLWDKPHYRNGTFQEDMRKNLRNVAIPGTGLALSFFCKAKILSYLFVFCLYPLICLLAALGQLQKWTIKDVTTLYTEQLLSPKDWFSFWRLNCLLASYHSLMMYPQVPGYALEDKWTFLQKARQAGVPISPYLDFPRLVVKDTNEEGGMGIFFYTNANNGGRWIIQEALSNDRAVSRFLPENAPLSTLRIITSSTYGIPNGDGNIASPPNCSHIKSLSCVFRAGRAGALTDHSSILFDVDLASGLIKKGTTNAHWYRLGNLRSEWTSTHSMTNHPDCGVGITGEKFDGMDQIRALVEDAHLKLIPDVPMAGWDVALTDKGVLLLEVNLSCNFFRGSFDVLAYLGMVNEYFSALDDIKREKRWKVKSLEVGDA